MKRFFSEDEIDALTELINIGVGGAAASLSRMIRRWVGLTVPAVGIVSQEQATEMMAAWSTGPLLAVEQAFSGGISGRSLLVLPHEQRSALFQLLMDEESEDEESLNDALRETGNVLLQGCLSTIANLLERELAIGLPSLLSGGPAELIGGPTGSVVVFVYVSLDVGGQKIRGYVALVLDMASVEELRALLADFVARVS